MYVFTSTSHDLKYTSNSQRALYQMIRRIRHLKSREIDIYTGTLEHNTTNKPYDMHTIQVIKSVKSIMHLSHNDSPELKEIILQNLIEEYNKLSPFYLSILIKFLKSKGHNWIESNTKGTTFNAKNSELKLIAAIDMSNHTCHSVNDLIKQHEDVGNLTQQELLTIQKYFLQKTFKNLDFNDEKNVKSYANKINNVKLSSALIHNDFDETHTIHNSKTSLALQYTRQILNIIFGEDWYKTILKDRQYTIKMSYEDIAKIKPTLINFFKKDSEILTIFDFNSKDALSQDDDTDASFGKLLLGKLNTILGNYFMNITPVPIKKMVKGVRSNVGCTVSLILDANARLSIMDLLDIKFD